LTLATSLYFVAAARGTSGTSVAPTRPPVAAASAATPTIPAAFEAPTEVLTRELFAAPPPRLAPSKVFPLSVRRVVLDAGHGGNDPGATSRTLTEKDITLDIGRRLTTLLQRRGFEVVTTREGDDSVPLRERARLANESRGDIFVSIHVNAILKHTQARGIETYYLGPTTDPSLTQLAASENSASGYSLADLRELLDGVYADARRDESQQLASSLQQHLVTRLRASDPGLENWGVKRAPFLVLVATDMPAVLAEVGCLSNTREAVMLARSDYRQEIAEALFKGIESYATANASPQRKGI
jgi:N-acetylmuramoyl-L-alanine amidase